MDPWLPSKQYSWGAFPVGPVANNVADQNFLWQSNPAPSNYALQSFSQQDVAPRPLASVAVSAMQPPFTVVPAKCLPLQGGCLTPPLAKCRSQL